MTIEPGTPIAVKDLITPVLTKFQADGNIDNATSALMVVLSQIAPGSITDTTALRTRLSNYNVQLTQLDHVGEEMDILKARIEELNFALGEGG